MLDETRINYAGDAPDLRLIDIDRVEVLEGPQGTLYGAGTLGGIYHIVSRQPDTAHWHGRIAAAAELTGGRAGEMGSAMLNAPLVPGVAGLRVVGYGDSAPGWIATGTRAHGNSGQTVGGRGTLAVALGTGWRVALSGLHQHDRIDDSAYVYAPHQTARPAQMAEPRTSDIDSAAAVFNGHLGASDLTLTSGYTWHDTRRAIDATQGASGLGLGDPLLFNEVNGLRMWDSEARLAGHAGRFSWLAGLSWFQAKLDRTQTLTGRSGDVASISHLARRSREAAAYADVSWRFARGWQADAGVRLFNTRLDDRVTRTDADPVLLHQSHTAASPSFGLSWQPVPGTTIYTRIASAFRESNLQNDETEVENEGAAATIQPGDRLDTVEIGLRQRLPAAGKLTASIHASRWRHLQSDTLQAQNIIVTRDAGTARILGGEVAADMTPLDGWHLHVAGDAEDARLTTNTLGVALADARLPVVPAYTVQAMLRRDVALLGASGSVGLGASQIGPGRLAFDPALNRRIGPRLETRLTANLHWQRFEVALDIDNLLDQRRDTFAFGNPFRVLHAPEYVPMRPRSVRLTLAINQ